jgi:hypothetical protein
MQTEVLRPRSSGRDGSRGRRGGYRWSAADADGDANAIERIVSRAQARRPGDPEAEEQKVLVLAFLFGSAATRK